MGLNIWISIIICITNKKCEFLLTLAKVLAFRLYMFDQIFLKFYSPLCNYVAKILMDDILAEDVVQELFIGLWEKDDLDKVENIEAYLLRAAKYKSIDVLRKMKRSATIIPIDEGTINLTSNVETTDYHDIEPMFAYLVAQLPQKTKEAFELSRIDGLSYKEIAEIQGLSVKTIENQIGNALKILRTSIKNVPTFLTILFFK